METNEDSTFYKQLDTELFIEEIRDSPCIWDYTSDSYSNRIERQKAWERLCYKFYDDFHKRDRKGRNECAVKLQKKWKSLRASYNRAVKKLPENGSFSCRRREYIYLNNLSFLKPLADRRVLVNTTSDSEHNEDDDELYIIENPIEETPTVAKTKITKIEDKSEAVNISPRLSNNLSKSDHVVEHADSDMHFLLSLHDRFKAIDNHWKLQAQIEILNVIQRYMPTHPPLKLLNDSTYALHSLKNSSTSNPCPPKAKKLKKALTVPNRNSKTPPNKPNARYKKSNGSNDHKIIHIEPLNFGPGNCIDLI